MAVVGDDDNDGLSLTLLLLAVSSRFDDDDDDVAAVVGGEEGPEGYGEACTVDAITIFYGNARERTQRGRIPPFPTNQK